MIQVTYYRDYHRVTVEGHANSGEFGHDLICAGVSALALTLAENAAAMKQGGQVRAMTAVLESGNAEITCVPVSRWKATVKVIFDSVCMGFDRLSQLYPEYIRYEIR